MNKFVIFIHLSRRVIMVMLRISSDRGDTDEKWILNQLLTIRKTYFQDNF